MVVGPSGVVSRDKKTKGKLDKVEDVTKKTRQRQRQTYREIQRERGREGETNKHTNDKGTKAGKGKVHA